MNPVVYVLSIVTALAAIALVVDLLRRGQLRERHAIWWLAAGVLALVVAVFPQILIWVAGIVGAEVPTNLVFFVSTALLFGVCVQISSELTRHEAKLRTLAEHVADLQLQVDDLAPRAAGKSNEMHDRPKARPDGDRDE